MARLSRFFTFNKVFYFLTTKKHRRKKNEEYLIGRWVYMMVLSFVILLVSLSFNQMIKTIWVLYKDKPVFKTVGGLQAEKNKKHFQNIFGRNDLNNAIKLNKNMSTTCMLQ